MLRRFRVLVSVSAALPVLPTANGGAGNGSAETVYYNFRGTLDTANFLGHLFRTLSQVLHLTDAGGADSRSRQQATTSAARNPVKKDDEKRSRQRKKVEKEKNEEESGETNKGDTKSSQTKRRRRKKSKGPSVQSGSKPKSENETSLQKSQSGKNDLKVPTSSFKFQETAAVASSNVQAQSLQKRSTTSSAKTKADKINSVTEVAAPKHEEASSSTVARETPSSSRIRKRHPAKVDDKEKISTKHFVVDVPSRHLVHQALTSGSIGMCSGCHGPKTRWDDAASTLLHITLIFLKNMPESVISDPCNAFIISKLFDLTSEEVLQSGLSSGQDPSFSPISSSISWSCSIALYLLHLKGQMKRMIK